MKPLGFAVIGCGSLAQGAHIPNILRSKRARLHLCCDVSEAALATCRDKFGVKNTSTDWRKAIADPAVRVIVLATTEKVRLPVIAAAAAVGKPVYVEKPLAASLEEMQQIQRVVNRSRIPFCVGHNRRCSPAMTEARQVFRAHMEHPKPCAWRWDREGRKRARLAENGTPGMNVRINDDWYSWKGWVFDPTHNQHGPMLFEMTHFTDLCNWFLAAKPVEVVGMENGLLNHAVIIRYDNGALATIHMCANGTFGYPKELYEVMGNGGIVVVDHMVEVRTAGIEGVPARKTYPVVERDGHRVPAPDGILTWLDRKRAACAKAAKTGDPMKQFAVEPDKGHAHAIERFIDQILGNGPEVCGVDDAVLATRICFAAIRSAHERRIVKLAEV